MRLIFYKRIWFVHIPFDSMVKIQSFEQFPKNQLLVTILVFLLYLLAAFVYSVINHFISSSVWPKLDILLRIIDFHLNIIGPNSIVLCGFLENFVFFLEISFSLPCPRLFKRNLVICCLKYPYIFNSPHFYFLGFVVSLSVLILPLLWLAIVIILYLVFLK